jgi:hypothetical protein
MDDEKKREGSGKSPTKFMERPGTPKKDKEQEQSHPEFINDDLDVLENQEKQDEDTGQQQQGWGKPARKPEQKPDPRKYQDPAKSTEPDSSSEDKGGDAC